MYFLYHNIKAFFFIIIQLGHTKRNSQTSMNMRQNLEFLANILKSLELPELNPKTCVTRAKSEWLRALSMHEANKTDHVKTKRSNKKVLTYLCVFIKKAFSAKTSAGFREGLGFVMVPVICF